METNTIDNILNDLGMSTTPTTPPTEAISTENVSSTFSNEDINDILEDNGFSEEGIQDAVFEEEDSEEERENTQDLSNTGQDDEMEHQLYQQALEEVDSEVNGDSEDATPTEGHEISKNDKIPLNSPTLLIDESTSRFSGAEWFNEIQKARIIVAGCGGIGSNLIFQLARMVPANITIYDDDAVEMVNMAGQLYSYSDMGKAKVDAIADMITSYSSMRQVNAIKEKFTSLTEAGDIMMCGFDNMSARKTFFNSWYEHIKNKSKEERTRCLLLDGRLSMDTLQIFCIRGDDTYNINRYQSDFLFSDYLADATVCSMKQTTYLACMIGSLMVNLFTNFVANSLNPVIPYDLPFFTEYDAQNMIFKTES